MARKMDENDSAAIFDDEVVIIMSSEVISFIDCSDFGRAANSNRRAASSSNGRVGR
jgi:hypothetical protein